MLEAKQIDSKVRYLGGEIIMTLGEKIKEARKQAGLTQEQVAEKLMVSRQAVTKWETDKGIPDIENLKNISKFLNVSIDYLLDNNQDMNKSVIRETIDLSNYGKGRRKAKKDKIIREKYPDAVINTLLGKLKLGKNEKIIDNTLGFLTSAPFGIPDFINEVKNLDKEFYLVNQGDKQFLVIISDEFIESRELTQKITEKKFEIGEWKFINCGRIKSERR